MNDYRAQQRSFIWFVWLCLVAVCGGCAVSNSSAQSEKPFFVTYHLGGVHLTDDNKWPKGNDFSGVYDVTHNYSLRDGDGPDGCEYRLTLRPGSEWNFERAEPREIFGDTALLLKTGRGVAIGDTMAAVKTKIGAPSKIEGNDYFYSYDGEALYRARYSFRQGRLDEIEFHQMRRASKKYPRDGCL